MSAADHVELAVTALSRLAADIATQASATDLEVSRTMAVGALTRLSAELQLQHDGGRGAILAATQAELLSTSTSVRSGLLRAWIAGWQEYGAPSASSSLSADEKRLRALVDAVKDRAQALGRTLTAAEGIELLVDPSRATTPVTGSARGTGTSRTPPRSAPPRASGSAWRTGSACRRSGCRGSGELIWCPRAALADRARGAGADELNVARGETMDQAEIEEIDRKRAERRAKKQGAKPVVAFYGGVEYPVGTGLWTVDECGFRRRVDPGSGFARVYAIHSVCPEDRTLVAVDGGPVWTASQGRHVLRIGVQVWPTETLAREELRARLQKSLRNLRESVAELQSALARLDAPTGEAT